MKTKSKPSMIPMVNNRGQVIHLDGSITIKDLAKMGIRKFRIAPVGTPLEDGWYQDTGLPDAVLLKNSQPPSSKGIPAEQSVTGAAPAGNNGDSGAASS